MIIREFKFKHFLLRCRFRDTKLRCVTVFIIYYSIRGVRSLIHLLTLMKTPKKSLFGLRPLRNHSVLTEMVWVSLKLKKLDRNDENIPTSPNGNSNWKPHICLRNWVSDTQSVLTLWTKRNKDKTLTENRKTPKRSGFKSWSFKEFEGKLFKLVTTQTTGPCSVPNGPKKRRVSVTNVKRDPWVRRRKSDSFFF